jgi:hypothetical protein
MKEIGRGEREEGGEGLRDYGLLDHRLDHKLPDYGGRNFGAVNTTKRRKGNNIWDAVERVLTNDMNTLSGRAGWVALYLQGRRRKRVAGQPNVPAAPASLTLTDNVSDVVLDWQDRSSNETGFRVYRDGALLSTRPAGTTAYADPTVVQGTSYTYYVTAFNANGESEHSNTVSVEVGA